MESNLILSLLSNSNQERLAAEQQMYATRDQNPGALIVLLTDAMKSQDVGQA